MGIEVDWEPVPDGHVIPHKVEVAEAAVEWENGQRIARVEHRIWQAVFWLCCVLVPTLIILGAAKHPSQ